MEYGAYIYEGACDGDPGTSARFDIGDLDDDDDANEIAGTVTSIKFESGQTVKQGDVLVELDSSVERAQLAALEARRELAVTNTDRTRALVQSQAIAKSQLDTDEAALKSSRSDLSALQATIGKKVVRAPFSGRLGIRNVNLGQYLQPGTAITVLDPVEGSGGVERANIAYLPSAFDEASQRVLAERYPDAIHVSDADGAVFGLNAASDGLHVFVSPRAAGFAAQLEERGYIPVPIDLSELLLGGGGIKCCTLELRGGAR